jgi:hypothetical protein
MLHRIKKLQTLLSRSKMAGALIWHSRDLLYYTGTCQPSWLVVLPDNFRLFIRSGYSEAKTQVFIAADDLEEERNAERPVRTCAIRVLPVGQSSAWSWMSCL